MTEEIQKNSSLQTGSGFWVLVWDRLLDTFDKALGQVTSGRWILTVAAAFIMVHACWNDLKNALEFKEILAVIIYAYFQKGDRQPEKGDKDEKVNSNVTTISTTDITKPG